MVDGNDPTSIAAHLPTTVTCFQADWVGVRGPPGRQARPPAQEGGTDALAADLASIFTRGLAEEVAASRHDGPSVRAATIDAMLARAAASPDPGGKWVLALPADRVNAAWTTVARLTAAGALGPAAKVATTDPPGPGIPQAYQLIVYTARFDDAADVRRVLDVLVAASLVPRAAAGARPIGYKVNAWTLLELGLAGRAALAEWGKPRWRVPFRTLYQSDRAGGGAGPAPAAAGKRPLLRVPGGAEAAAAAVAAALAGARAMPALPAAPGSGGEGGGGGATSAPPAPAPFSGPAAGAVGGRARVAVSAREAAAAAALARAGGGGGVKRSRSPLPPPPPAEVVALSSDEEEGGGGGKEARET